MGSLHVEQIHFGYEPGRYIIEDCSFTCNEGEVVALVGPSGSGKTTLLKLIASILQPLRGRISCNGSISYMPQEDLLLPWRSVIDNILLPCELGSSDHSDAELQELLKTFKLDVVQESLPAALSGGMQRRVALLRALMNAPKILLLDEPFASIDIYLREQLFPLLRNFVAREKRTLLFVTHDFRDAALFADRILFFAKRKIHKEWLVGTERSYVTESHLLEALRSIHETSLAGERK